MNTTANRPGAAYERASTKDQTNSHDVQRRKILQYCDYVELALAPDAIFEEKATSGSKPFFERPAAQALMDHCEEQDIREIVFYSHGRAFRDAVDAIQTARFLTDEGYRLHFLDLHVDTNTPAGRLMLGQMALWNQFEREQLIERVCDTRDKLIDEGRPIGAEPYGWQDSIDPLHLGKKLRLPNEREQKIILQVFRLNFFDGDGADRIARYLNQARIPTKKGGAWQPSSVQKILDRGHYVLEYRDGKPHTTCRGVQQWADSTRQPATA